MFPRRARKGGAEDAGCAPRRPRAPGASTSRDFVSEQAVPGERRPVGDVGARERVVRDFGMSAMVAGYMALYEEVSAARGLETCVE